VATSVLVAMRIDCPAAALARALLGQRRPPLAWAVRWSRAGRADPARVAWREALCANALLVLLARAHGAAVARTHAEWLCGWFARHGCAALEVLEGREPVGSVFYVARWRRNGDGTRVRDVTPPALRARLVVRLRAQVHHPPTFGELVGAAAR
jgi:hypothetical protein